MKKLFLLTIAAVGSISAYAQSQQSVVFTKQPGSSEKRFIDPNATKPVFPINGSKTTASGSTWFDYVSLMYSTGLSKQYVSAIAPDSNIKVTYSNGTNNVNWHGFGVSFDPTDSVFQAIDYDKTNAGTVAELRPEYHPSFAVWKTNAYSVDSISFPLKYFRNDPDPNVVDTLIINVLKGTRTAATQTPGLVSFSFTATGHSCVSPIINPATAKIDSAVAPGSQRIEIVKPLTAAVFADTFATGSSGNTSPAGYLKYTDMLALGSTLNLNAGDVIVIYVTFRSQKNYPLNTPNASANYVWTVIFDLNGDNVRDGQSGASHYASLQTTNQTTYHASPSDTLSFRPLGHNTAIPNLAYADGVHSHFAVKLACPTCVETSVDKINTNVVAVSAYPNPAADMVTIKFGQKTAVDATVSITNAVGQVIASKNVAATTAGEASFSTVNLSNGLYFYTVESNGQRTTDRFVVAH